MSGWLPSFSKVRDSRPAQFGEPPYEWQPSRTVEATYSLLSEDEAEYWEFRKRADHAVTWQEPTAYAPREDEPSGEKLRGLTNLLRWARVENELWLLIENPWAYFPDPLPYELHVKSNVDPRFRYLGHFGCLPDHWQNIPQRRA